MTRLLLRSACAAWLLIGAAIPASALELPEGAAECLTALQRASALPERSPRLADECPDVAEALLADDWSTLLDAASPEGLDASALSNLIDITERYRQPEPGGPELSVQVLRDAVAELAPFQVQPEPSLWSRMLQWMEQWLAAEGQGGLLDWLREVTFPDQWARATVWVAGAMLVLGALIVVLIELWHGGVLRGRRRWRASRRGDAAAGDPATPPPALARLDELPAARQPVVLLALIVERLRRRHAGRFGPCSTHRELVAAAADLQAEQRHALEGVAVAAERITFGAWRPRSEEIVEVLRGGRLLLSQLPEDDMPEEHG